MPFLSNLFLIFLQAALGVVKKKRNSKRVCALGSKLSFSPLPSIICLAGESEQLIKTERIALGFWDSDLTLRDRECLGPRWSSLSLQLIHSDMGTHSESVSWWKPCNFWICIFNFLYSKTRCLYTLRKNIFYLFPNFGTVQRILIVERRFPQQIHFSSPRNILPFEKQIVRKKERRVSLRRRQGNCKMSGPSSHWLEVSKRFD